MTSRAGDRSWRVEVISLVSAASVTGAVVLGVHLHGGDDAVATSNMAGTSTPTAGPAPAGPTPSTGASAVVPGAPPPGTPSGSSGPTSTPLPGPTASAAPRTPAASSPPAATPRPATPPSKAPGSAAPQAAAPPAAASRTPVPLWSSGEHPVHVVQAGDSLWRIAARTLGPKASAAPVATLSRQLWDANRGVIGPNPDLLRPGQVLVLPAG